MAMPDITIMGAGIFGLSLAWEAVERGARVVVVDPYGPGAGSSGGIVGALAPHVPENWNAKKAFQFESLLAAGPFWQRVEAAGGASAGYARTGRLQPVADEAALALARARSDTARSLWQGQAEWRVLMAEETGAWSPETASGYVIHDTLTARLHPRQAVKALVAALAARGVPVETEAPSRGAVVWATGWQGLRELSDNVGRPIGNGVKGQAVLLRHDATNCPQIFADGLHIVPHADGTVAVGSTSERDFIDPGTTDAQCDELLARAHRALPVLRGAPEIARWAGIRPRARSRAPMIGPWPGRDGQYVMNGGFKIGFGMAPALARVMADLVLDGIDQVPDGFRVTDNL